MPVYTASILTPRQAKFAAEYVVDLNATRAAIRAGYSKHTAATCASRLLRNAHVRAVVRSAQAKQLQHTDLTAQRVLEEMRRLAFSDLRCLFDESGNLKPLGDLSDAEAAAIASVEVLIKNAAAGDRHTDVVHKVKAWDKTRALEQLGKHFGLLKDSLEVTGGITLSWQDSAS